MVRGRPGRRHTEAYTTTGLEGIPAWFLRLARLFNQTIMEGTVPQQWKTAAITPLPKVPRPTKPSEFRSISVTPVLSRSLEKYVVRHHIYPALHDPPPQLNFEDQYQSINQSINRL